MATSRGDAKAARSGLDRVGLLGVVVLLANALALTWMLAAAAGGPPAAATLEALPPAGLERLAARVGGLEERASALALGLATDTIEGDRALAAGGASDPRAARLARILARTAELERKLTGLAWKLFVGWADARLSTGGQVQPEPADPVELARFARLRLLGELAYREPDGWAYPAATHALQAELLGNVRHLPLRLLALKWLRRLGPRHESNGRISFVSLAENETIHGDPLVPDEAVEGLIEIASKHPELRHELHRSLQGVRHPALHSELIDAMRDPRPYVREGALRMLLELPSDPARDAALSAARRLEPDARLRTRIDAALGRR